jgi:peptide/nickel transport system permease protein
MRLRIAQYFTIVLVLLSLNFFLPRMMPGDPLSSILGNPNTDTPLLLTEEMRQNLLVYYGLDKPLGQQYMAYLRGLARGDLGWSIYYNAPVASVLLGRLKWSLFLGGTAAAIYIPLGILLGALSAWRRGTRTDLGLLASVFFFGSWPPYFLGMVLIVFFGFKLNLFPIGGAETAMAVQVGGLRRIASVIHHWALPCCSLVITYLPGIYLLVRNTMLGVLRENYVRTARAKGLREWRVMFRHVLPNSLLPVVTVIAMRLGFLIVGTVAVEVVFAYPGVGTLIYQACAMRDYPVLQGAFLSIMACVIVFNLAADLLYVRLDPRVEQVA